MASVCMPGGLRSSEAHKPSCDAPRLRAPQRLETQLAETNAESYQAFPILVPLENVAIPLDFDPDFGPARHLG